MKIKTKAMIIRFIMMIMVIMKNYDVTAISYEDRHRKRRRKIMMMIVLLLIIKV